MKKLFLSAAALLTISLAAQAQSATDVTSTATTKTATSEIVNNAEEQKKVPVKLEDLPEAVKKALSSQDYAAWKAETAFLIKGDAPYYEINVKNEAGESAVLKLDAAGVPVKK